jgi:glutathione S-transferase
MNATQAPSLTLVSHALCPYVQRAAIVLAEKGTAFQRRDVDLADKPAWFLKVSPLGKTPVLLVEDAAIFESAVICEYLDDTLTPRLHPEHPLTRARHRAWMEFGSATLNTIAAFYSAADESALGKQTQALRHKFIQVEDAVSAVGPYFAGPGFCMVDAVFGPIFRYFDVFDIIADFGVFSELSKTQRWRQALSERSSVKHAVHADYRQLLMAFLRRRNSALSARIAG